MSDKNNRPVKKTVGGKIAFISTVIVLFAATCYFGYSYFFGDDKNSPESTDTGATEAPDEQTADIAEDTAAVQSLQSEDDAGSLQGFLINNIDVWQKPNMLGGSLIDLDFDGTPEFLVLYGEMSEWGGSVASGISVYKISDDEMTLMTEITGESVGNRGAETSNKSISLYTDDNGKQSWFLSYTEKRGNITEDKYSLFDFTGDEVSEFVKYSYTYTVADNGHDTMDCYIDEQLFTLTDAEIAAYNQSYARYEIELEWYERDPDGYLRDSAKEFYSEFDDMDVSKGVNPPRTADVISPDVPLHKNAVTKWHIFKEAFERKLSLTAATTAYKLDPNIVSYGNTNAESIPWYDAPDYIIKDSVAALVEAYMSNNKDYLFDCEAFTIGARAKPVIYLYPKKPTDINVQVLFNDGGYFTCTYPDYGNGWNVTAYPDGTIINRTDGREYSYLYWEGKGSTEWDFSSGFVVRGEDTAEFLQEKLEYLGLTPREYNEFIVYWLPLMQDNKYNLITFQTELYEKNVRLNVTPEPDSVLRVFMAYKPLESKLDIREQKLKRFRRKGFSVIEWGGTEVR